MMGFDPEEKQVAMLVNEGRGFGGKRRALFIARTCRHVHRAAPAPIAGTQQSVVTRTVALLFGPGAASLSQRRIGSCARHRSQKHNPGGYREDHRTACDLS